VKWFSAEKRYGFITVDDDGSGAASEDVFAHQSQFQGAGFTPPEEGQRVSFEVEVGPRGLQASDIRAAVESAPPTSSV
jgi:CspA family cold shock protein